MEQAVMYTLVGALIPYLLLVLMMLFFHLVCFVTDLTSLSWLQYHTVHERR